MKNKMAWRNAVRWTGIVAVALAVGAGAAYAKLPQPPMDDAAKAKSEEARAKAIDAAKKEAEQLARAQDRVADRYKKGTKFKGASSAQVVAERFPLLDVDHDGCIDLKEAQSAPELMANFRGLDENHDGRLCSAELRDMAMPHSTPSTAPVAAKKK